MVIGVKFDADEIDHGIDGDPVAKPKRSYQMGASAKPSEKAKSGNSKVRTYFTLLWIKPEDLTG